MLSTILRKKFLLVNQDNRDYGGAANGSVPNPDELFVVVFDENGLFPPNGSPPIKSVDANGSALPYKNIV